MHKSQKYHSLLSVKKLPSWPAGHQSPHSINSPSADLRTVGRSFRPSGRGESPPRTWGSVQPLTRAHSPLSFLSGSNSMPRNRLSLKIKII